METQLDELIYSNRFTKIEVKDYVILFDSIMGLCQSSMSDLKNANNDIPFFDFKNETFTVKVVDVYDGDTCTVVFKYKNELVKFKVRCMGYDSPEMKPPLSDKNRKNIIEKAIEARNYFIDLTSNCKLSSDVSYSKNELKNILSEKNTKLIKMECHGMDKYGRMLGTFFVNNVNVNNIMIKNNHGYPYYGGTKLK